MCSCKITRKYTIATRTYNADITSIILTTGRCNGLTLQNTGNRLVVVNQAIVLQPGQSLGIGGNEGEIFTGRVQLNFTDPNPVPVTPVNGCAVMEKIYEE